jgi:hypothetical protein
MNTADSESPDIGNRENDLRNEVTDMIAYALWRHWKLRPPERDLSATRRWARCATDHLDLCGIEWTRKPPAKYHSDANFDR